MTMPHRIWLAEPDGTLANTDRLSLLNLCSAIAPGAATGQHDMILLDSIAFSKPGLDAVTFTRPGLFGLAYTRPRLDDVEIVSQN